MAQWSTSLTSIQVYAGVSSFRAHWVKDLALLWLECSRVAVELT